MHIIKGIQTPNRPFMDNHSAMYRVKQLFGGYLTLRDYNEQVGEAMAMIQALKKMTRAGMPESVRIA